MTTVDFRGPELNLVVVQGDDHTLTIESPDLSLTGDTLVATVVNPDGSTAITYTATVADADTAVLSMPDVALPVDDRYSWHLRSLNADRVLRAGSFEVAAPGTPGVSSSTTVTVSAGVSQSAAQTLIDASVAAHVAAADPHPTYTTAAELAAAVGAHEADTTNVHGIANTALLATLPVVTSPVGRTIAKLRAGQNISISWVGDSGLEGNTATAGNDCASVVKATLDARFGVTTVRNNRAVSGRTTASVLFPSLGGFSTALADSADLYVISFGHNDIRSEVSASFLPGTGCPIALAQAALEHMIRRIRIEHPDADIIVTSSWQYTGASAGSNTPLEAHQDAMRAVAQVYGCGWADYYGALAALGNLDTYIHASGGFAQHPTDAGHAVWASVITNMLPNVDTQAAVPALPTIPLYGAEQFTHAPFNSITTAGRSVGTDGFRVIGAGWSSLTAMPATSSTAGNSIEVQWIGRVAFVRLDVGAGQGTVSIALDGTTINASLNLGSLGGVVQAWLPIVAPHVGPHRAVITIVSGSVTCRGVEVQPAVGQKIPFNSPQLVTTGNWSNLGTAAEYYDNNAIASSTNGNTITIEWVGTDLTVAMLRYTSAMIADITTDGVTRSNVTLASGNSNTQGGEVIEANLDYGHHVTVITAKFSTGTRSLAISTFFAWDRRASIRPDFLAGFAISGETVDFGGSLAAVPFVTINADDTTSTTSPSPSSQAVTGFVANGTASARLAWSARVGRRAF